MVAALTSRAIHLTRAGAQETPVIEDKSKMLKRKLAHIRDLASIRKLRLQDAYESQMVCF